MFRVIVAKLAYKIEYGVELVRVTSEKHDG